MAHIKCPIDYIPLQQVTAANLNAHVNNAQLQPGAISDHTALPDPLASGDQFLVNDVSATPDELRSITAAAIFSSDLPVTTSNLTTSTITGKAGANINVTAPAGYNVNIPSPITTTGVAVTGNGSVSGTLTVTSGIVTGNISSTGTANFTGAANFTGGFQIGGSSCYVLYEVYEETLPDWVAIVAGNQAAVVTTASFTKPANEIWEFEIDGTWTLVRGYGAEYAFRYSTETFQTGSYLESGYDFSGGVTGVITRSIHHRWTVPVGTALSARTVVLDVSVGAGSQLRMFPSTPVASAIITTGSLPVSKFRIYKYKTA